MQSRHSPGHEVLLGRSLASVGRLGAEINCYLSHYHIVWYYCIAYDIILTCHIILS